MTTKVCRGAVVALCVAALVGCSGWWSESTLRGTVTYRERIALTPNAVITVSLLDASFADGPAITVAETTFTADSRQVPLAFTLGYDKSRIEASHRYVVRGTIKQDDLLLFTTDQSYPVLTEGAPESLELMLVRARPSALTPDATSALPGRLVLAAEALHFVACGETGEGLVVEDQTGGEAATIVRDLGGEGDGVTALVRLDGNRLLEVRYAGLEGPTCEELPADVEVVARGQEPFWSATVAGGVLTVSTPDEAATAYPGSQWTRPGEDRWQFAAARSDSAATLDLVEERCIDSMSGARYPFSATLTRNGQELHGCAVEGRPAT